MQIKSCPKKYIAGMECLDSINMIFYRFFSRDYMTLDRYTTERGISLVPSVDVDASIGK